MADKKKKDEKAGKPGAPKKKKGGKLRFYTIMLLAGIIAPFMFPTAVLLFVGMLPTIFAFFIDKDRQYSSAIAIGAMNCAGITPFIIDLWLKGQTMGNVFQMLGEPSTWLIILGAAAVGQMIVSVIPQAMATVTLAHSESRIKHLKKNLEQLQENWGSDVGTTKPIEKVISRN